MDTIDPAVHHVLFGDDPSRDDLVKALDTIDAVPRRCFSGSFDAAVLADRELMEAWARVAGMVCLSLYRPEAQWQSAIAVCSDMNAALGIMHYCFSRPMKMAIMDTEPMNWINPMFGVGPQPAENVRDVGGQFALELTYIAQRLRAIKKMAKDAGVRIGGVLLDSEMMAADFDDDKALLNAKHTALYYQSKNFIDDARTCVWFYNHHQPGWERRVGTDVPGDAACCSLYEPWNAGAMATLYSRTESAAKTKRLPVIPCISLGAGYQPTSYRPDGANKRTWTNTVPYSLGYSWNMGRGMARVSPEDAYNCDIACVLWGARGNPMGFWRHFVALILGVHGIRFVETQV